MQFPTVVLIDKALDYCRRILSSSLINVSDRIGIMVGGWAVYVIAVLLFVVGIIAGIRGDDVGSVVIGFLLLPAGVILQYVAVKMVDAVDRLVNSTPTSMHAQGFLSVIAVAGAVIGAIGVPVTIIYGIIEAASGNYPALVSVLIAFYLLYLAALALNPSRIAVRHSDDTTIGQEAIGLATFIIKSVYKFVPVLFGVAGVVVAIQSIIALVDIISMPGIAAERAAPIVFGSVASSFVIFCLIPLLGYILFLFYYLFIDVLRALLTLGVEKGAASGPTGGGSGRSGGSGGGKRPRSRSSRSSSASRGRSSGSSGSTPTQRNE